MPNAVSKCREINPFLFCLTPIFNLLHASFLVALCLCDDLVFPLCSN